MEDTYGCNLINTKRDGRQVTEFVGRYHVHILVRQGQMTFSDGKNSFTSLQGDLAIWQMSNTIQSIECSVFSLHWRSNMPGQNVRWHIMLIYFVSH